jgi:hypothetical protein
MTNTNYTFSTPEFDYTFVPDLTVPNLVSVQSREREALEILIDTLALDNMADDDAHSKLVIEEDMTADEPFYYIEITTSTLALYLQFEVLNYLPTAVSTL